MWVVHVYRDLGYTGTNYAKTFDEFNDAYTFFEQEIRTEFDDEIEAGVVHDQELQNILNAQIYTFENDTYEVTITLEEAYNGEEIDEDEYYV